MIGRLIGFRNSKGLICEDWVKRILEWSLFVVLKIFNEGISRRPHRPDFENYLVLLFGLKSIVVSPFAKIGSFVWKSIN